MNKPIKNSILEAKKMLKHTSLGATASFYARACGVEIVAGKPATGKTHSIMDVVKNVKDGHSA